MKKYLGTHSGRKVFIEQIEIFDDLDLDFHGELCLIFPKRVLAPQEFDYLVQYMVRGRALSIWVSGLRCEENFDRLLNALSTSKTAKEHIMTGMANSGDLQNDVLDFLSAGIPDEDRWDEWKSYRILLIFPYSPSYINDEVRELSSHLSS